jgi:hypothetical protein
MSKTITNNQITGEIGETAVKLRFLDMGFQFDARSRLEAGIDGIAEVMDSGRPLARMIAVQVKATDSGTYPSEDEVGFSYSLRSKDLEYWRGSNLPVIIVLYRRSDGSLYWQPVPSGFHDGERRLRFVKERDVLDRDAVDRLADLTVPKNGFGHYVPPLGEGEDALVNILPVILPPEMYVASTPHSGRQASAILLEGDEPARFDWTIRGGTFWSFHDPRTSPCREIVDVDQVEAIETGYLAFHPLVVVEARGVDVADAHGDGFPHHRPGGRAAQFPGTETEEGNRGAVAGDGLGWMVKCHEQVSMVVVIGWAGDASGQ